MTVDVEINREKCQGFGKCVNFAPETFTLDDEKKVVLGEVAASMDDALLKAAKSCPYRVITISTADRQIFPPAKKPAA